MIEYFSAILAVPSAVDAALSLLARIRERKDLSETVAQDISKAESELSAVKDSLAKFAVAFDELDAWKQVHDLSSTFKHDLRDAIAYRMTMKDRSQDYANAFGTSQRSKVLDQLDSLYDGKGAITALNSGVRNGEFSSIDQKLNEVVADAGGTPIPGAVWHEYLKGLVESLREHTHKPDGTKVFEELFYLDRFLGSLNSQANKSIMDAVEEYAKIIHTLRDRLHLDGEDA
ncbi:MAG: hypothetical protein IID41_06720 [Planctomycetes bacterium]|nr:hypothetical protein [Planctomycetota bacterium]